MEVPLKIKDEVCMVIFYYIQWQKFTDFIKIDHNLKFCLEQTFV
jgi:hypothetical protein